MKKELSFGDDGYWFLNNARKIKENKTVFDGLHYFLKVTLDIGEDGFASKGRVTHRNYTLGTWEKWDWSQSARLDYNKKQEYIGMDSPSKIQSKLKSRGIHDISISKLEEGIISSCIEQYNCGVRWEREHKLQLDFESRCSGFIAELDELKKKYALNIEVDTYVNEYEEAEVELILKDKSNLSDHVHEKYVTNELGFES